MNILEAQAPQQHKRRFPTAKRAPLHPLGTCRAMAQLIFLPQRYRPPKALPMSSPNWADFLAPNPQAQFIWFGHSSLLAQMQGQKIFFDPVFARYASPIPIMAKRFQAAPAPLKALPPMDWIVISHNHYDHLDRHTIGFFARQKQCRFAVPLGLGKWLAQCGVSKARIQELDWWQFLDVSDAVRLHALPSLHYSGRHLFDGNRSLCCSYALCDAQEKFYFSGDSFYGGGAHFAAIGQKFGGFDVAFIENGQYHAAWRDNHMQPQDSVKAALDLQARRLMPIHWGAYALSPHAWNAPVIASSAEAQRAGVDMLTPLMGEVFSAHSPSRSWWRDKK